MSETREEVLVEEQVKKHRMFRRLVVLAGVLVLLAAAAWCAWSIAVPFHFYPRLSPPAALWRYLPCAAYVAIPTILHLKEALAWRD